MSCKLHHSKLHRRPTAASDMTISLPNDTAKAYQGKKGSLYKSFKLSTITAKPFSQITEILPTNKVTLNSESPKFSKIQDFHEFLKNYFPYTYEIKERITYCSVGFYKFEPDGIARLFYPTLDLLERDVKQDFIKNQSNLKIEQSNNLTNVKTLATKDENVKNTKNTKKAETMENFSVEVNQITEPEQTVNLTELETKYIENVKSDLSESLIDFAINNSSVKSSISSIDGDFKDNFDIECEELINSIRPSVEKFFQSYDRFDLKLDEKDILELSKIRDQVVTAFGICELYNKNPLKSSKDIEKIKSEVTRLSILLERFEANEKQLSSVKPFDWEVYSMVVLFTLILVVMPLII